jgi:hypothetical protein
MIDTTSINKKLPPGSFLVVYCLALDQTSFLESGVRAVLGHGTETLGRHLHCHVLVNLRDVDTSLLEVWLASNFPARVKLRRTSAVTVAAAHLGFLAGNVTLLCHKIMNVKCGYPTTGL